MAKVLKDVARPKKEAGEAKDSFVRVRLTVEQKREVEAAAKRMGLDLSAFARVAMLEKARRAPTDI